MIHRATVDELEPYVTKFVGSTGGGQWRFQLMCKYCEDLGTISAKKHSIHSPKTLRKAAENFISQGWRFEDFPICPTCFKRTGLPETQQAEHVEGGKASPATS